MRDASQKSWARAGKAGWILYDGECGFCVRWIHLWRDVVARRGFATKDLQTASAEELLHLPPEKLLDDILVLTADGEIRAGADAYLYVARRIWWAWPFYAIFSLPGFNRLMWVCYRWFNRNRYCVSRRMPSDGRASRPGAPGDSA